MTQCLLALIASVLVLSCTAPIRVHEGEAAAPGPKVASPATLKAAARSGGRAETDIGILLDGLRDAARAVSNGDEAAIPEYNYLTARLVDRLINAGARPWNRSMTVRGGSMEYRLRGTQPADLDDQGREFITTDRLTFSGRYAGETGRGQTPGIGAPLVAFLSEGARTPMTIPYRAVTAVVRFEEREATVDLLDPFEVGKVSLGGRSLPLRADFNAPVAYLLSKDRIDRLGLARLIDPVRYKDTAGLVTLQPYDPDRIPVLLVHGLQDTPATFAPMYFELMADPEIRMRYQFWAFSYPSGYPFPVSAAILRRELRHMRERHPDHKDIVIIGHSMGGLVSRLMVTDVGDRLWRDFFGKSPAETDFRGESRRLLEASLVFDARDEIGRAIFMSSPHRGSELASNFPGRLGVKLVRFPTTLADIRDAAASVLSADDSGTQVDRFPNSIDTLSPHNLFIRRINQYPIRPDIPYHSIIGDRGRGDTPNSSDGVVAYWSSHLEGAASEKIVPSGHTSDQHPEGIEEVRRILHVHASLPYQPDASLATPQGVKIKRRPGHLR
jgi:pimeloyl-ACP methyl ester carboxylesterase